MKKSILASIATATALTTSTAWGHPGHGLPGHGLTEGWLHPLTGFDHLLAMVAVGLLAAQFGGRAMWALPGAFVGLMAAGGLAGMAGWDLPAIEYGIAGSIVVLGAAVALDKRFGLAVPLALVGLFGFVHGHAHGTEMPAVDSPWLYALGLVAATACLHASGVCCGQLARKSPMGSASLRLSGAAIALAGVWLALSV